MARPMRLARSSTLRRSPGRANAGSTPTSFLENNDAYAFFERLGDLITWGPTGTNVGDLHVLLVPSRAAASGIDRIILAGAPRLPPGVTDTI